MDRLPFLLCVLAAAVPSVAAASPAAPTPASNALVVVVEAPRGLLDPRGVRRVLGVRLGRPCLSLLDEGAPEAAAVLSVVLDARGRGRIELRPRGGVASYVSVRRPRRAGRSGGWLAQTARQLVDAAMSTPGRRYALCREVLDPWPPTSVEAARAARLELPSEVLDPFADSPLQTAPRAHEPGPRVMSEVLDPWSGYHPNARASERAERLSRPRPEASRPRRR
ncbi:MAG: hypothetical protein GXP55_06485 [Deltaproteobacteria bacterium]|nr:hypothetical protein [Deltaproteobacteria bacterium]